MPPPVNNPFSFSFSFADDDIDTDANIDIDDVTSGTNTSAAVLEPPAAAALLEPKVHGLDELVGYSCSKKKLQKISFFYALFWMDGWMEGEERTVVITIIISKLFFILFYFIFIFYTGSKILTNQGVQLAALPPSLTYTTLTLPAASPDSSVTIPRRDLFDVRLQLMSEDPLSPDPGSEQTTLLAGLGNDDIDPNIYEGGLKSWECSLDLVGVLARERVVGGERGQGEGLGVLEVCECFVLLLLARSSFPHPARGLVFANPSQRTARD
jgi:hypothetical protein